MTRTKHNEFWYVVLNEKHDTRHNTYMEAYNYAQHVLKRGRQLPVNTVRSLAIVKATIVQFWERSAQGEIIATLQPSLQDLEGGDACQTN